MTEPDILATGRWPQVTGNRPMQLFAPVCNSSAYTGPGNDGMAGHRGGIETGETHESRAKTAMQLMLMTGRKLLGKTLGIVGFGHIGRETARRAHFGFGMKILVHDLCVVPDDDLDRLSAEQVDGMDHLLGRSDFVSLHCSADTNNRHLIDALRLNRMKPDAYLINTAGTGLVDEEALADALWYDTIAGAGLDATPTVCDRLRGCENVVVLQSHHTGSTHTCKSA